MKYNFTLTIVILLLLVALRASQHIDRAVPKDLITEYLEDLRKLVDFLAIFSENLE